MNESLHPSACLVQLIQDFESFRPRPYLDKLAKPNPLPTIGYGSTYYKDGTRVTLGPLVDNRSTKSAAVVTEAASSP